MSDTMTLKLKRPIQIGETDPVGEINLEEPTVGQIETATKEASAVGMNIMLISQVAKVSPAHVRAMMSSDFNKAVEFISGFTQDAPAGS